MQIKDLETCPSFIKWKQVTNSLIPLYINTHMQRSRKVYTMEVIASPTLSTIQQNFLGWIYSIICPAQNSSHWTQS